MYVYQLTYDCCVYCVYMKMSIAFSQRIYMEKNK